MREVDDYLDRARAGDAEAAFFGILELQRDPIPALQEAFQVEHDPQIRSLIVLTLWQRREPSTAAFLAEVLDDPEPETWKQALDGLVTLGTPEARRALASAMDGSPGNEPIRRDWIAEMLADWDGSREGSA